MSIQGLSNIPDFILLRGRGLNCKYNLRNLGLPSFLNSPIETLLPAKFILELVPSISLPVSVRFLLILCISKEQQQKITFYVRSFKEHNFVGFRNYMERDCVLNPSERDFVLNLLIFVFILAFESDYLKGTASSII